MICIIDYLIIATLKLVMLSNFTQLMHINTATYKLTTALGVQLQDTNCIRSSCLRIIQIRLLSCTMTVTVDDYTRKTKHYLIASWCCSSTSRQMSPSSDDELSALSSASSVLYTCWVYIRTLWLQFDSSCHTFHNSKLSFRCSPNKQLWQLYQDTQTRILITCKHLQHTIIL